MTATGLDAIFLAVEREPGDSITKDRLAELLDRAEAGRLPLADVIDVPRLSAAMSRAYKSVGAWSDFPDAVTPFAAAIVAEYDRLTAET